jgi:Holliday junction resolvasome RuvABC endonuclease subunit
MDSLRFCSIDASTNNLAYAIFEGRDLISHGKINFSGASVYEKISTVSQAMYNQLNSKGLELAIMERAVFMNSPKTMSELSMVQGAIMAGLFNLGIGRCLGVPPITWQNFIGNKALSKMEKLQIRKDNPGKSDSWYKSYERDFRKLRTINFVNMNYDLEISDNDIADAIAIGHYSIYNKEWGVDNGRV